MDGCVQVGDGIKKVTRSMIGRPDFVTLTHQHMKTHNVTTLPRHANAVSTRFSHRLLTSLAKNFLAISILCCSMSVGLSTQAQISQPLTNNTDCSFKIRIAWLNTMSVPQTSLFTIAPNSVNNFTLPANAVTITQGRLYTTGGNALSAWFQLPGYHLCYFAETWSCPSCGIGLQVDLGPTYGIRIRCGTCGQ